MTPVSRALAPAAVLCIAIAKRSGTPSKLEATSPAAYRAQLKRTARTVVRALDGVSGADTQEQVSRRLFAADERLERARAGLLRVPPPPGMAGAHTAVLAGLEELSVAAAVGADEVDAGDICTAPYALARLTRPGASGSLRAAAAELREQGYRARGLAPPRHRARQRTLANGMVLRRQGTGTGLLTVRNGNDTDAVVVLADGGNRISVFVRRHRTATVDGVPDGKFRVYLASGRGWDAARNTFGLDCSFEQFERRMAFRAPAGMRTTWKLTLKPALDGNAPTTGIDPGELPR
jgi:hypothetical protein